ncbi:hypothetical protein RH915_10015 [Serpentinicella sp. ANB-PHB4]|nr:hypothetical protein [Serpentinicella sp. ANB-PHB4]MDR5659823.1 hypothetical protein [Serpentinicella sp. ANB-PHB4]
MEFTLIFLPILFLIPAFITYFIIKLAVKSAIKELKDEKVL